MLMRAATVVQQLCKSCWICFMFYCMFYFTCDRSFKEITGEAEHQGAEAKCVSVPGHSGRQCQHAIHLLGFGPFGRRSTSHTSCQIYPCYGDDEDTSADKTTSSSSRRRPTCYGGITTTVKHAIKLTIKLKTQNYCSYNKHAAIKFKTSPTRRYAVIGCNLQQNANEGCNSCVSLAGPGTWTCFKFYCKCLLHVLLSLWSLH